MCYSDDASPPAVPLDLATAVGEVPDPTLLTLRSADGSTFAAAFVAAPEAQGPLVVVLPDIRGLFGFYEQLAVRFAEAGHHAIAIDYFGRTAGASRRGPDFAYEPHLMQTTPEQVQADVAAAIAEVTRRTGETRAVLVGFCFGGSQSYLATINTGLGVDGVVAFYGGLDGSRRGIFPSPVDLTDVIRGPLLGLFGGADAGIPAELVERFEKGLTEHGAEHEIVVYPGAPHSFFDRKQDDNQAAAEDAWRRVLSFLDRVPA